MSHIHVIRSEEFYKHHQINSDLVLLLGIEKAAIVDNIVDKRRKEKDDELHLIFPYIEKERFYELLEELIEEGHLVKNGEGEND